MEATDGSERIFVSFNQADEDWAAWICDALADGGHKPVSQVSIMKA
jgi:hypothetical protein